MRIRAKLNISFSLLIILAISSFALISYFTFKGSIGQDRDAIYTQKIEQITRDLEGIVKDQVAEAEKVFLQDDPVKQKIKNYASWASGDRAAVVDYFDVQLRGNSMLSAIALLDGNGRLIQSRGQFQGPPLDQLKTVAGSEAGITCPCDPVLIANHHKLFVIHPFSRDTSGGVDGLLVYQTLIYDLENHLYNDPFMKDFLLFIVANGKPIFKRGDLSGELYRNFNVSTYLEDVRAGAEDGQVSLKMESEDHFVFNAFYAPLKWTASYVVPQSVYYDSLIKLRERIIIAVAIIIWMAINSIFVIAYKIAKPLGTLSKASKDMIFYDYNTPLSFVNNEDEIAELAGNFEAMRQKVKELTTTDSLTGVLNRRFFMVNLEKEYSRVVRTGGDLCCLMLDIDNFKGINDTWGHQCGDEVLRQMGALMMEKARKYDIVGRYGGEEFTIILPDTDCSDTLAFAERLRERTQDLIVAYEHTEVKITISIGMSSVSSDPGDTPELLIKRADDALYEAKRTGKNKTVSSVASLESA